MQPLPKGPAALDAVLRESPCELGRPRWIGVEDERDLGFVETQYAVHLRLVATGRAAGPLRIALARIAAVILGQQTWKRLGFVREADYARERLGISKRELQGSDAWAPGWTICPPSRPRSPTGGSAGPRQPSWSA